MRRRLKTVSDVDEVTLDGRLFQTREAATENARSPMVEWRIGDILVLTNRQNQHKCEVTIAAAVHAPVYQYRSP